MSQITLEQQGQAAKAASRIITLATTQQKDQALETMAKALQARSGEWLEANEQDMAAARESGMSGSLMDRLALTKGRIDGVVEGLLQVKELQDPCGTLIKETIRPNGLRIEKRRVPPGGHRHHLRGPTQRDRGRGSPVSQVRQCGHSPWGKGSFPIQPQSSRDHEGCPRGGGTSR